jgi:hypothetical protein
MTVTKYLSPEEKAAAITAIRSNPRKLCGISAAHDKQTKTTAIVAPVDLHNNIVAELDGAMATAFSVWPNADVWEVVGSDLQIRNETGNPMLRAFRSGEVIGTFSSSEKR